MAADYFILPRDGVIARLVDGCIHQVWQPNAGQWADFDFDVVAEANAVPPEVVQRLGANIDDESGDAAADVPATPEEPDAGQQP